MPVRIFSNVLLPEPLRPMIPSVSPRRTLKEISSNTFKRSTGRGRKRSNACSRMVDRRTLGIRNDLLTRSTSTMPMMSEVLGGARRVPPEDHDSGAEDQASHEDEQQVRSKRWNGPLDQDEARELNDRRRWPQVQIEL